MMYGKWIYHAWEGERIPVKKTDNKIKENFALK